MPPFPVSKPLPSQTHSSYTWRRWERLSGWSHLIGKCLVDRPLRPAGRTLVPRGDSSRPRESTQRHHLVGPCRESVKTRGQIALFIRRIVNKEATLKNNMVEPAMPVYLCILMDGPEESVQLGVKKPYLYRFISYFLTLRDYLGKSVKIKVQIVWPILWGNIQGTS